MFTALRSSLALGYSRKDLVSDLMAGLVVALVAVPLGMALAIASGVSPQQGLYTVIVAGVVVSLAGGSRYQVSGPTAAFVVILVPIVHRFGLAGLLTAGMLAGLMMIAMGFFGIGKLIRLIPQPVTLGFTAGIGLVIATIQIKDFLGINFPITPDNYFERIAALSENISSLSFQESSLGIATLLGLILWPRVNKKIPAPLVILALASGFAAVAPHVSDHWVFATIGSKFGGVPSGIPDLNFPWNFVGSDGRSFDLTLSTLRSLFPSAFAIAMLGGIESLLSAVVADGMTQTKHDPDAELIGIGVGNVLAPFVGGIAATGAIARTATNIKYGARSPLAAAFHGAFALLAILFAAPLFSYLPMASLAGLLMLVAFNMSEVRHLPHFFRISPRSDVIVFLICFFLTVVFDMVIGVTGGVLLAMVMFLQTMAGATQVRASSEGLSDEQKKTLGDRALVFEISGPLFFGAANRAISAIENVGTQTERVAFLLDQMPVMDMTGFVAFETLVANLCSKQIDVLLVGLRPQPLELLKKSGIFEKHPKIKSIQRISEFSR